MLRNAIIRPARSVPLSLCQRSASTRAISNPTLVDIEKRWEAIPPQEQAELWMNLRDRMKSNWNELTLAEKKASYWIAFGPHGPRAAPPPGENKQIFLYTVAGVGISFLVFWGIRQFARPPPKTMSREWQEKTNEYLKEQKVEPITGYASEGYTGPGAIQSK
ncbi:cytochrome c oxidase subunit IV family [Peziza echinospora]|nr:cytochrome c oxidase subunit IV family [Peziza echinospora]